MDGHQTTLPPHVSVVNPLINVEHALTCARGGFPTLRRHNEVRDITATLLTEACHEVCVEPDLQPVAPGQLSGAANQRDGARLDVAANGV